MAIIENKENEKFKELLKKENLTKEDVMKMSDEQVMKMATKLILQTYGGK